MAVAGAGIMDKVGAGAAPLHDTHIWNHAVASIVEGDVYFLMPFNTI